MNITTDRSSRQNDLQARLPADLDAIFDALTFLRRAVRGSDPLAAAYAWAFFRDVVRCAPTIAADIRRHRARASQRGGAR